MDSSVRRQVARLRVAVEQNLSEMPDELEVVTSLASALATEFEDDPFSGAFEDCMGEGKEEAKLFVMQATQ